MRVVPRGDIDGLLCGMETVIVRPAFDDVPFAELKSMSWGGSRMHVMVVRWDPAGSAQGIDALRDHLRDQAVDAYAEMPGPAAEVRVSDRETNRWGAVLLWGSREAARRPTPGKAAESIGYPPTERPTFDVEAAIEDRFETQALSRLGPALARDRCRPYG